MMSDQNHTINYHQHPSVSFPNSQSMKAYLEAEALAWTDFLEQVRIHSQMANILMVSGTINIGALVNCFEVLKNHLGNPDSFNQATQSYRAESVPPPPSSSIEGQVILGLIATDRAQDAMCAYLSFIASSMGLNLDSNRNLNSMAVRGGILLAGAYAANAIPFGRTSSQKLAGMQRAASSAVEGLKSEIGKAQKINLDHSEALQKMRSDLNDHFSRIKRLVLRRERYRRLRFSAWKAVVDKEVSDRFEDANRKLRAVQILNKNVQKERDGEFKRLVDLFYTHLRLRAPVQLWEARAEAHRDKSETAFERFLGMIFLAVAIGIFVPYFAGDYIANSFFMVICTSEETTSCARQFSAKGPLTVAGLLVVMSLVMWAIRLQYRIYLSERHLALDASEKQAFAETFMAIKEGASVSEGSEAIVLSSLFRPTQDGIIKDDDSGLDISAATILAKQLGRPGA